MTEQEYKRLYLQTQKNGFRYTRSTMRKLREVYIEAAELAAEEVKQAIKKGYSDLTVESWRNIEAQLTTGSRQIFEALDDGLRYIVPFSSNKATAIDEKYLIDIIKEGKLDISTASIQNMFISVDVKVVANMVSRIYSDGYTYSQRVWNAALDYQEQIKRVISAGLASGRDIIDIAEDIGVYVRKDRQALVKRYGDFVSGNRDWLRRIRKDIDYNALRLVRSEIYASLQQVAVENSLLNPGSSGIYDWVRQNTTDWGCNCPDNAAGSPYTLDDLPSYDHPNCLCIVVPILKPRKEFVDDLTRWSGGESIGYLDTWEKEYFQYFT